VPTKSTEGTWSRIACASSSLTGSAGGNFKPVAAFTVASTGLTANFTDGSSDADGGVTARGWKFGDGATSTLASPSHAYNLAGGYSVQFTATDGAGASNCVLKQVNVNPPNTVLSNGVPVTGLASNIGGQLPFSLVVPAGASNLHFDTTGGSGDADLYVKFGSPPTLSDFDCVSGSPTPNESCALASATPGTWYVMVHAYGALTGISLTGSFDAGAGNTPPVANFNYSTSALTANFTDASTDSDGSIASRSWNFGDGASSTSTNPAHTYATGGTYTVQLTVTDNNGATNSTSKQVTVSSTPTVSISVLDASIAEGAAGASRTLSFKVQLSAASSTAVKFNIATADGTALAGSDYTAKTLNAVNILPGALSKSIGVIIKGDATPEPDETFFVNLSSVTGATVADGQAVGTILNDDGSPGNLPPVANFSFTTSNLTANFTDASTDSDGSIASRSWNFGDGATSTATNPSHAYATGGTYTAQLTVTDNNGATNSTSKQVTVAAANVPPVANFSFTTSNLTANFTDASTDSDGSIASRSWNFGDGATSTSTSPSHAYATGGTCTVQLTVTDNNGATNSTSKQVTVAAANVPPVANFSFTTSALTANFTDSSTDSDGSIASRSWNFGDGATSTATNPSHAYATGGTYTVQLTVTDNKGATNSTSKQVTVSSGGGGITVSVVDASVLEGDSGQHYLAFKVQLSAASAAAVKFDIATADGTALAGSDYVAKTSVAQTIPAGTLSRTFVVSVNGDTTVEPDETVFANLSNVTGATVADAQGTGTIKNDD